MSPSDENLLATEGGVFIIGCFETSLVHVESNMFRSHASSARFSSSFFCVVNVIVCVGWRAWTQEEFKIIFFSIKKKTLMKKNCI